MHGNIFQIYSEGCNISSGSSQEERKVVWEEDVYWTDMNENQ